MKNIITRYVASPDHARAIAFEMIERQRFPIKIVTLFDTVEGLEERLTKQSVDPKTAKAYQDRIANDGGAIVMVRAGERPLAVAKKTRTLFAEMGVAELGDLTEEVVIREGRRGRLEYYRDYPHILTRPPGRPYRNNFMANWPIGHISRRKPFKEMLFPPHSHMANWPIALLSDRKPYTGSIFPRHARMANFPIPLLSKRKPFDKFAFPRHARMAAFPIPLLSQRKPYTGSIIARHARMANWPFPHLIDGKRHTNSLMPNAPRMANFPIPLLSGRKPFTGSIFPRHARMANFPIRLISRRKPFDKFAFPRHARMADAILPLVIRREQVRSDERKEFSFSRLLGLPTLIKR